jgi:hypothetical protein
MLKDIVEFFTGIGYLVGIVWLVNKIGEYFYGEG